MLLLKLDRFNAQIPKRPDLVPGFNGRILTVETDPVGFFARALHPAGAASVGVCQNENLRKTVTVAVCDGFGVCSRSR